LDFLEAQFSDESRPSVQELIAVSFLENLGLFHRERQSLRARMGPALTRELDRQMPTQPNTNN
jgi:hypothetical protein